MAPSKRRVAFTFSRRERVIVVVMLVVIASLPSCSAENRRRRLDMSKMSRSIDLLTIMGESYTRWPDGVRVLTGEGFPPNVFRDKDGNACISWRLVAATLLSLDEPSKDKPWTSPENQAFDKPSRMWMIGPRTREAKSVFANIFALVGPGTAYTEFQASKKPNTKDLPGDAILLLECQNNTIHWIQPGDIELDDLLKATSKTGIGDFKPSYPDGFLVTFADGTVWYISKDVPKEAISKFYTVEGARKYDRREVLGPYILDEMTPEEASAMVRGP